MELSPFRGKFKKPIPEIPNFQQVREFGGKPPQQPFKMNIRRSQDQNLSLSNSR